MLPHLAENGWEAEILAVLPDRVEAPLDPELAAHLPPALPVHRVDALPVRWTRPLGWGSLARRAYGALQGRGDDLVARGRFDVLFVSTSQFGVLPLACRWFKRHGLPYVLDFQDEWVSNYYRNHPAIRPPGGRIKYAFSSALSRWQEGPVVRHAAQIVSVAERTLQNLRARHPHLAADRLHVLPFGGAEADFALLTRTRFPHEFFCPGEGTNWVCVGRGGPGMRRAATAFFLALRRSISNGTIDASRLRLHFIGTAYATGSRARPTFPPIARTLGLESLVRETTGRVPYYTALQCLRDADAVLVMGTDDPGYTASRIFSCLLARRPLLSIFHRQSSCLGILEETTGGVAVPFDPSSSTDAIASRIYRDWFACRAFERPNAFSSAAFAPYTAGAMTRRLCAILQSACVPAGEKR